MSVNTYTPNTIIQSALINADLSGLANGSNDTATNSISTFRSDLLFDCVASGCILSGDSYAVNRNASQTAGVIYIGGVRLTVSAVSGRTYTASKDTYVDSNNSGVQVYTEVTNNAASPALAASSIRLGIVVTGATTIAAAASVNQGSPAAALPIASSIAYSVSDSLGNLIYPSDANRKVLSYRQVTSNQATTSASYADVTGLNASVIIPANRKVKITGLLQIASNNTDTDGVAMNIIDVTAGTTIGESGGEAAGTNGLFVVQPVALVLPAASGARTYKCQFKILGAGTGNTNPSASGPAFILVELA